MTTPNTDQTNLTNPPKNTTHMTQPEKPKMVKMKALADLKLLEKFFSNKGEKGEMRDIKKGTIFSVPEDLALDLEKVISGYPKFQGNRDECEVAESINKHVRAERVIE